MSLRTKFTIYISLLILLIITGISLSIIVTQKSILTEQLGENREKIIGDFIFACREALYVKDEIQVLNTIRSVIRTHDPSILYAGYVSPSGTTLFSSLKPGDEATFKTRLKKLSRYSIEDLVSSTDEKIREVGSPIYLDSQYLGAIIVGFSESYLESQIDKGVFLLAKRILNVAVFALLAGILMANITGFYLNKPIKLLANAADEIGRGDLNSRITFKSNDEFGKLVTSFNEMGKRLKELDELKDGFVSSVSHELRSPLTAIEGYCDYLLDGLSRNMPQEKREKSLRIIKDATLRLSNFINNILDLAKIKAGKFELKKNPMNVVEVVDEIVLLFHSLAENQKKKLNIQITDYLPLVDADAERVKQVLTNLIGNALKFTGENDEITVGANLASPEYVVISVKDTGVGIPEGDINKIFDKFYQVKESEMQKPKGTGLGLSIAAEIVNLHGGDIWVESTRGEGSTFNFTLPVLSSPNQ
jgi:signal transduction histidine kinase